MASTAIDLPKAPINLSTDERIASAIAGAVLLVPALGQPSRGRIALAVIGAALLQRGLTGHCALYEGLNISTASTAAVITQRASKDPVQRTSEDSFPARSLSFPAATRW